MSRQGSYPIECIRCGRTREHGGRGLCRPCWRTLDKSGDIIDYRRTTRPAADLLEDVQELISCGVGATEAVTRMGYKPSLGNGLMRALQRAGRHDLWRALRSNETTLRGALNRREGKAA